MCTLWETKTKTAWLSTSIDAGTGRYSWLRELVSGTTFLSFCKNTIQFIYCLICSRGSAIARIIGRNVLIHSKDFEREVRMCTYSSLLQTQWEKFQMQTYKNDWNRDGWGNRSRPKALRDNQQSPWKCQISTRHKAATECQSDSIPCANCEGCDFASFCLSASICDFGVWANQERTASKSKGDFPNQGRECNRFTIVLKIRFFA